MPANVGLMPIGQATRLLTILEERILPLLDCGFILSVLLVGISPCWPVRLSAARPPHLHVSVRLLLGSR